MKKAQEEQLQKTVAQQRAQIEKLQQDNETLAKAVEGCSRSIDSILAVVTEQYGSADEFGSDLALSEDAIKDALNLWEVTTKRVEHDLLISIRRRE